MRSLCVLVFAVLCALSLSMVNVQSDEIEFGNPSAKNTIRVLFIGNSYTFFNDLPVLVSTIAASAKPSIIIETAQYTRAGYSLEQHWNEGQAVNEIRKGWHFVVLQEYSTRPIQDPERMYEFARKFDAEIKASGAQTVFFMTWARQHLPDMIEGLAQAYTEIAAELGARLAPVGRAWEKSIEERPDLVLHLPDQSHPSVHGSYLAACVFFTVLTGKSPLGLAHEATGGLDQISERDIAFLQRIALATVEEYSPGQALSLRGKLRATWGWLKQTSE